MQLFKYTRKNTGTGSYAPAVTATRADIGRADEIQAFMDAEEVGWKEKYGLKAWAIAHSQVTDSTAPKALFVVHKDFLDPRGSFKNSRFKDRRVFNPEIVSAPTKVKKHKPERKTVWNEELGKRELKDVMTEYEIDNTYKLTEGCMSFPANRQKNMTRLFAIRVRYQYPVSFFGFTWLKTVEEDIEGLKAHVFQHEIEHCVAENIYYAKGTT